MKDIPTNTREGIDQLIKDRDHYKEQADAFREALEKIATQDWDCVVNSTYNEQVHANAILRKFPRHPMSEDNKG